MIIAKQQQCTTCGTSLSSKTVTALAALALLPQLNANATDQVSNEANAPVLANLSLEQLSQITVVTASRHRTSLANTAAAVTVLNDQDITRSGATRVAEVLRTVPGLDVAQINAAEWAITSRGFNGRFSNKLLVMVDGRSVYTPLLAGVYWDTLSPIMEDLDRIEVVRGPGASLWGANAVYGVINILSKSAQATQGGLVSFAAGTEARAQAAARYGFSMGDGAWLRVNANYLHYDDSRFSDGSPATDGWEHFQSGFRGDWQPNRFDQFTLQGDYFTNTRGRTEQSVTSTGVKLLTQDVPSHGTNLLGRWTHDFSATSKFTLQSYYDHTDRNSISILEVRDTVDVSAQHYIELNRNRLVWGMGYRWSGDHTTTGEGGGFVPADYSFQLYEAFVQDEIALVPDRLQLTLGSKLEHNTFTGFELQPDIRMLWTPTQQQSYWASVSRAVRTPNRADTGANFNAFYVPAGPNSGNPAPLPVIVRAAGNQTIKSEFLVGYQAGWRMQYSPMLSVDTAVFYNDYADLILGIADNTATFFEPTPPPAHLVTPVPLTNAADGYSYGGELAVTWQLIDSLRLVPYYSYLYVNAENKSPGARPLITLEDSAPRHQLMLRTSIDATQDLSIDINIRWIDKVPAYAVASYSEADLRVAWRVDRDIELSIVGQNLLHNRHNEFGPQTSEPRYDLERGVYAKLLWRH